MSRLSDADTVRLADEYFPRQPDGTRRSRDKYFDGHLDGSEYVYGMGAFLSDADQIPIDQLRALVASFELVGDFGQAARKDYDNFYFFVPPTTRLVMYGPTVRIPLEAIEGGGEIMLDDVREEMDISHARILLAEDHPTNQKVVQLVLGAVGIEPVIVENGRLALDALRAERFDVVLMDMQMPELDGLSATSQLRAREHAEGLPRTPVIMLTANALDEHVRAGREAGADAHLSKPIRADALIEAIIAAMADAEARAEAAAA